jgi:hypothetical protein
MKKLLIILLSALSLTAVAQEAKKVAILETVDKMGDVPYGVKLQVRMSLTDAISNTSGYEGYDRVDMASIMGEQNFQRTGMVSDAQIKKLGEMTGAAYILVLEGAVAEDNKIFVTAKILNVETTKVDRTDNALIGTSSQAMQRGCRSLASKMFGSSAGVSTSTNKFLDLFRPKNKKNGEEKSQEEQSK